MYDHALSLQQHGRRKQLDHQQLLRLQEFPEHLASTVPVQGTHPTYQLICARWQWYVIIIIS